MSDDTDVLAELDVWLGAWEGPDDYRLTVQRARDEIVALRKTLHTEHDEALEEAAQIIEAMLGPRHAGAIRTLKEKRGE